MSTPPFHRRRAVRLAAVALTTVGLVGLAAVTVAAAEAHGSSTSSGGHTATGMESGATTPPGAADLDPADFSTQVRSWINQARRAQGLDPLHRDTCATAPADRWSGFLAVNQEFSHQDLGRIMTACQAGYASEALARGDIDPRTTVDLWLQSPQHRRILLDPRPDRIGVGAYLDGDGRWVVTVVLLGP